MTQTAAFEEQVSPFIGYFCFRQATPSWHIEASVTDFIDISYIVRGSAFYTVDGREIAVTAGDLLCLPSGVHRLARPNLKDLFHCYCVNFQLHDYNGNDAAVPFQTVTHIGIRPDLIDLFKQLSAAWLQQEPGHVMKSNALFQLILQKLYDLIVLKRDAGRVDGRVQSAINYILTNYEKPIGITDAAREVRLNQVYFGALFKQETGMSFRQYLTMIRLNHAENMLAGGEYNIGEVALLCGFSDMFYFSKVYKQNRGVSPSKAMIKSSPLRG